MNLRMKTLMISRHSSCMSLLKCLALHSTKCGTLFNTACKYHLYMLFAINSPFFPELHLSGTIAASIPALRTSMTTKTLGNALSVQSRAGFLVPTIRGLDECSVISHLFLVCRHSSQTLHHAKKFSTVTNTNQQKTEFLTYLMGNITKIFAKRGSASMGKDLHTSSFPTNGTLHF